MIPHDSCGNIAVYASVIFKTQIMTMSSFEQMKFDSLRLCLSAPITMDAQTFVLITEVTLSTRSMKHFLEMTYLVDESTGTGAMIPTSSVGLARAVSAVWYLEGSGRVVRT